jgi:hypothetical protein
MIIENMASQPSDCWWAKQLLKVPLLRDLDSKFISANMRISSNLQL